MYVFKWTIPLIFISRLEQKQEAYGKFNVKYIIL